MKYLLITVCEVYMKYLITFAYGSNVECLVDVSYKAIDKYVVNMDHCLTIIIGFQIG